MTVYVLHFDPPLHHARYYVGYTRRLASTRVAEHIAGHGSPLVRAVQAAGGRVRDAWVWPDGTRALERRLKRRHGSACYCPYCQPGRAIRLNSRLGVD